MNLTDRQNKLLAFVTKMHEGQLRKYSDEPYVTHCIQVAELLSSLGYDYIEIALCHDLLEDTECTHQHLYDELMEIGYACGETTSICFHVKELTDVFTHEKYPKRNRTWRKIAELGRLVNTTYKSQTVKYADLIHNTSSIVDGDIGFARLYLDEKEVLLEFMNNGHIEMYRDCLTSLRSAKEKLLLKMNKHHSLVTKKG